MPLSWCKPTTFNPLFPRTSVQVSFNPRKCLSLGRYDAEHPAFGVSKDSSQNFAGK